MSTPGEVLVAILNNQRDFGILQNEGWYRIPISNTPKRWPPTWLAFYQTKIFDEEKYTVRYYGKVQSIQQVKRYELFPHELFGPKTNNRYYKVTLEQLLTLPQPIRSTRPRRIVFVPTTWQKFTQARQFNDLFNDSPLEDILWQQLELLHLNAERQWGVTVNKQNFFLDFAIFCNGGSLDVEADGDSYHIGKEEGQRDRQRNNALATAGWHVLRFNTQEIRERMTDYCVPRLLEVVNRLGGLQYERDIPRIFYRTAQGDVEQQLTLFEDSEEYDADV